MLDRLGSIIGPIGVSICCLDSDCLRTVIQSEHTEFCIGLLARGRVWPELPSIQEGLGAKPASASVDVLLQLPSTYSARMNGKPPKM